MPGNSSLTPGTGQSTKTFFGHPIGLLTLFFTEMWERFSFYGNRGILILYMGAPIALGGLGFPADKAGPIYAMYTSLVYLMTVPGGWLADKFLGPRRSVLYGGLVIMTGHILLVFHSLGNFYAGLACIALGTGLLKPNISVIVGQLYSPEDKRRESGYTLFYMGINLGALFAPLVTGFLAQSEVFGGWLTSWGYDPLRSWHWGFAAAAVGMFFGLVQYLVTGHRLGTAGMKPAVAKNATEAPANRRTLGLGIVAVLVIVVGLGLFDRTATYLSNVQWTSSEEGVLVTGSKPGSNQQVLLNKGKHIPTGAIGEYMGEVAAAEVKKSMFISEVTGGTANDSLRNLYLLFSRAQVQKLLPLKEVRDPEVRVDDLWWSSANSQLTLTVRLVGDSATETVQPLTYESFQKVVPVKLQGKIIGMMLKSAADSGRVQGSADGQHIKIGGLNTRNLGTGYSIALLLIVLVFFGKLFLFGEWTHDERSRLRYTFILFCGAAIFWGIFEQAGSTLTLFAERSTNNSLFGWTFPSAWWQSLNPLLILCLGSVFTWFWLQLANTERNPSFTAKFGFGLLFAGLGFLLLVGGASLAKNNVLVSPLWLLGVYVLHTVGELCLSPVGLSAMNKLAPARVMSVMMGVWFLASSVGNLIGGTVAGLYETLPLPYLFTVVGASGLGMALLFFLMVKPVKRMLG
ncbi:MAG: oligopeptide:H+ symporter [Patescibacteria group bacterium]